MAQYKSVFSLTNNKKFLPFQKNLLLAFTMIDNYEMMPVNSKELILIQPWPSMATPQDNFKIWRRVLKMKMKSGFY